MMKPSTMRWLKRGIVPVIIVAALLGGGFFLMNGLSVAVFEPSGVVASSQKDLFILTMSLSAIVVIPVFVLLIVFSFRYREGNTKARYRPEWGENRILEFIWWGIPIVIIGILGVVTYTTSHSLDPYKSIASSKPALEVQVITLQWKWLFLYPQYGVATLNHMPIEVDRPVHFSLTADAPMSSFWIPKLGSQIYTMKGMQTQLNLMADEEGDFSGYNTNINGEGYSDMGFTVKSRDTLAFSKWAASAQKSPAKMDVSIYETLSQPSIMTNERTYRLPDPTLFTTLLDKSMKTSGHSAHSTEEDS